MAYSTNASTPLTRHIKGGFLLLKSQILASILSFFIYSVAFMFLKQDTIWMVIYSIVSMIASFLFVYADAFKMARDDLNTRYGFEHYSLKGLVMGLVPFAITLLLILCWQITYLPFFHSQVTTNQATNTTLIILQTLFVGYSFPFRAFMGLSDNHVNLVAYVLIFLWPLMSATVGYIGGLKDFSIYNRLIYPVIYRNKKEDKNHK